MRGDLNFIVTRSGSTGSAVTVNYATSNGTATSGANYTAANGTVSFSPGVTSQTIVVPTRVDGVYTSNLLMTLNLSSPSGASLANAGATGTIVNTDPQPAITAINPTLSFSQSSVNSIDISALVNLNGRSGSITSFVIPSGVGTATIATDKNSVSYSAPYVGSSCDVAPVMTFSATYTVIDNGSGQAANGSATIKVKGSKKPISQCLQ
jgi:chitinase